MVQWEPTEQIYLAQKNSRVKTHDKQGSAYQMGWPKLSDAHNMWISHVSY